MTQFGPDITFQRVSDAYFNYASTVRLPFGEPPGQNPRANGKTTA